MIPDTIQSLVLFKDAQMLVLNKPAGIAVHAGPKGAENLEEYFPHLSFGYKETPGLAHRLDRDTSGCLILGRNAKGLRRLGQLFMTGRIGKVYWAVVHGKPAEDQGVIDAPLRKRTADRRSWWMEVHPSGQTSVTEYRFLGHDPQQDVSWIAFHPKTGRTHQIRIHAKHLGIPLLGDRIYGQPDGEILHLHSRSVTVPLYVPEKQEIVVEAPPPTAMLSGLQACGFTG